jgi:hypothetical protein
VQAQDIEDIEILIVGDGVDESVRSTVERLQAADSRIRFFDFPKGPRNGEIHRDGVLRQARGRIVCYQADDDLWLPGHLQDMEAALEEAFSSAPCTSMSNSTAEFALIFSTSSGPNSGTYG